MTFAGQAPHDLAAGGQELASQFVVGSRFTGDIGGRAVLRWRASRATLEYTGEVGRVGKSYRVSRFRNTDLRVAELAARLPNPVLEQEFLEGHVEGLFEGTTKMRRAHAAETCHRVARDPLGVVLSNEED